MEVQPTLEIDSIHSDANTEASASSPGPKDKRKKKKKAGTNLLGSLYSFDQAKQHRLDEEKALHKSSTFPPTSSPRPIPVKFTKAFEYEDAHDFESSPSSPFPFSSSCPSRSALRGGHEGLGLGPRPKLHVRWAVDVRDPPETSISHTLRSNQRSSCSSSSSSKKKKQKKNKKSKSKMKTVINCAVPNEPPSGQPPHFFASDAEDSGITIDENPDIPEPEASSDNPSWLSFLDVAMQHMLMASSFLAKENVAAALIEYKAAAHVFRLAKAGAETETSVEDQRSGVEQALRGQVLAWIAMATLYSASGQLSKGQKCHNLAVEACQDVGLTLSDLKSVHGFQNHFSSHCSLAACLSSDKSEKSSRTEII